MAAVGSESLYKFSNQYLHPDFPSMYRDVYVTDMKNSETSVIKIVHEFFQSGKYKGERMVEVGCGPTIHRLATPSKYYDEIITSDYAPENIKNVKKWMESDPKALDWTPLLEIIAETEGYNDVPSGVKEIEARIRQKVKSVIHCDVLKKSIFDPDIKEVDLLITAGCLESVCSSQESFVSAVKNLGSYVKPGGYIMMFTCIRMSPVEFLGKRFEVLSVDEDIVLSALKEAGFVQEQRVYRENDIPILDFSGYLMLLAKKLRLQGTLK